KEDGQNFYEVSCIYDGSKIDAIYRPDGSVAAVEEVIPESELPDAVKEGFAAEIKNGAINAAEKIDKDGKRLYELKAINNKSEKQYELIFSADGKMINKEMKKTEEREDEETEGIHKEGSADVTIPDAVKAAFKAKFPGAAEMEWGMESDSEYEAEFELNEAEMSANFDPHGKWLETETTLSAKKLPAQVAAAMKKDFGDYDINKIEKLEKAEKPVMYEIILTKGGKEIEVILDETGRIHKKR
ncbi:MAG: PepSY-like domain-containing protein, partial [Calditrichaceae bacterium]